MLPRPHLTDLAPFCVKTQRGAEFSMTNPGLKATAAESAAGHRHVGAVKSW
jgi:hypothetical protein